MFSIHGDPDGQEKGHSCKVVVRGLAELAMGVGGEVGGVIPAFRV